MRRLKLLRKIASSSVRIEDRRANLRNHPGVVGTFGHDSLIIGTVREPARLRAATVGTAWEQYALCAPATSRDCESACSFGLSFSSKSTRLVKRYSRLDLMPWCDFIFDCYPPEMH